MMFVKSKKVSDGVVKVVRRVENGMNFLITTKRVYDHSLCSEGGMRRFKTPLSSSSKGGVFF